MGPPENPTGHPENQEDRRKRLPRRPRMRRCLLKGCEERFAPRQARQRYCSEECRESAREWSRWKAQEKYRATRAGKQQRNGQSRRYRRKHFIDTIKLIAYRAETSMASLLREKLSRADDARALLRQIYDTEVDLIPDIENKTLTVRLHHLTQAAHDEAVRHLCDQLNATATIFPDTELRLVYQLGASQIPGDQEF
jgi:hypothetical protein